MAKPSGSPPKASLPSPEAISPDMANLATATAALAIQAASRAGSKRRSKTHVKSSSASSQSDLMEGMLREELMTSRAEVVKLKEELKKVREELENEAQLARETQPVSSEAIDPEEMEELVARLQAVELENEELITSLERLKYEQLEVETMRLETQMLREAYIRGSSRTDKMLEESASELRDLQAKFTNAEEELRASKESEMAAQQQCQVLEIQIQNTTEVLEQSEAEVERLAPYEAYAKSLEMQKVAMERDLRMMESRLQQATQDILSQRQNIETSEEQIMMLKKKLLLLNANVDDC